MKVQLPGTDFGGTYSIFQATAGLKSMGQLFRHEIFRLWTLKTNFMIYEDQLIITEWKSVS